MADYSRIGHYITVFCLSLLYQLTIVNKNFTWSIKNESLKLRIDLSLNLNFSHFCKKSFLLYMLKFVIVAPQLLWLRNSLNELYVFLEWIFATDNIPGVSVEVNKRSRENKYWWPDDGKLCQLEPDPGDSARLANYLINNLSFLVFWYLYKSAAHYAFAKPLSSL